jgi:AraC family transcriptional regulator
MAGPDSSLGDRVLGRGEFLGRVSRRLDAGPLVWVEIDERELVPVPRHAHASAHLCVPFRGAYAAEAEEWCEGRDLGMLFHPAGTVHADRFRAAGGGCLTVSLDAAWLAGLFGDDLPARSAARHDAASTHGALQLLRAGWAGVSAVELEEAALLALACFAPHIAPRSRGTPDWVRRARRALDECCERSVRVAEIARAVGVHPVAFARGFRRCVGCAPLQYLRRARIQRAVRRLRWSRAPLADVALASGFADQAQFTRAMRMETGWTPAALRARLKGG